MTIKNGTSPLPFLFFCLQQRTKNNISPGRNKCLHIPNSLRLLHLYKQQGPNSLYHIYAISPRHSVSSSLPPSPQIVFSLPADWLAGLAVSSPCSTMQECVRIFFPSYFLVSSNLELHREKREKQGQENFYLENGKIGNQSWGTSLVVPLFFGQIQGAIRPFSWWGDIRVSSTSRLEKGRKSNLDQNCFSVPRRRRRWERKCRVFRKSICLVTCAILIF